MNIIQFLFQLIQAHVLIPDGQFNSLEAEALNWYKLAGTSPDDPPLLVKAKTIASQWYVQMGLALLFIFANKWVLDFMSEVDYEDEPEDKDSDRD